MLSPEEAHISEPTNDTTNELTNAEPLKVTPAKKEEILRNQLSETPVQPTTPEEILGNIDVVENELRRLNISIIREDGEKDLDRFRKQRDEQEKLLKGSSLKGWFGGPSKQPPDEQSRVLNEINAKIKRVNDLFSAKYKLYDLLSEDVILKKTYEDGLTVLKIIEGSKTVIKECGLVVDVKSLMYGFYSQKSKTKFLETIRKTLSVKNIDQLKSLHQRSTYFYRIGKQATTYLGDIANNLRNHHLRERIDRSWYPLSSVKNALSYIDYEIENMIKTKSGEPPKKKGWLWGGQTLRRKRKSRKVKVKQRKQNRK